MMVVELTMIFFVVPPRETSGSACAPSLRNVSEAINGRAARVFPLPGVCVRLVWMTCAGKVSALVRKVARNIFRVSLQVARVAVHLRTRARRPRQCAAHEPSLHAHSRCNSRISRMRLPPIRAVEHDGVKTTEITIFDGLLWNTWKNQISGIWDSAVKKYTHTSILKALLLIARSTEIIRNLTILTRDNTALISMRKKRFF